MLIKIESPALFYEQLSAMNVVMNDVGIYKSFI